RPTRGNSERRDGREHERRDDTLESNLEPHDEILPLTSVREVHFAIHCVMRFIAACLLAAAPCVLLAAPQRVKPQKTATLVGCVEPDLKSPGQFVLTESKTHERYRVTGVDFREYVGRIVQVDGGAATGRVKIKTGLKPNPNVAAQAGAIDPAR